MPCCRSIRTVRGRTCAHACDAGCESSPVRTRSSCSSGSGWTWWIPVDFLLVRARDSRRAGTPPHRRSVAHRSSPRAGVVHARRHAFVKNRLRTCAQYRLHGHAGRLAVRPRDEFSEGCRTRRCDTAGPLPHQEPRFRDQLARSLPSSRTGGTLKPEKYVCRGRRAPVPALRLRLYPLPCLEEFKPSRELVWSLASRAQSARGSHVDPVTRSRGTALPLRTHRRLSVP
jgi:hypothetical protein